MIRQIATTLDHNGFVSQPKVHVFYPHLPKTRCLVVLSRDGTYRWHGTSRKRAYQMKAEFNATLYRWNPIDGSFTIVC